MNTGFTYGTSSTKKKPSWQMNRLPSQISSLRTAEHNSLWSTVAHYFYNNKSFTMYYKVMKIWGQIHFRDQENKQLHNNNLKQE